MLNHDSIEASIKRVCQNVLSIEDIDAETEFFLLGTDSIHAIRVIQKINSLFSLSLSQDILFQHTTVRKLARYIQSLKKKNLHQNFFPMQVLDRKSPQRLSFSQERLWFLDNYLKKSGIPAYNMPLAIQLNGKLDVQSLEKAFLYLIDRHEILRTVFVLGKKGPEQKILNKIDFRLQKEQIKEKDLLDRLKEESLLSFNLSKGPLFRATLFSLKKEKQLLFINQAHIISDGWSIHIFFDELKEIYKSFLRKEPPNLDKPRFQYVDFAIWQRKLFSKGILSKQLEYWCKQLEDIEVLNLFTDKPRPKYPSFRGNQSYFTVGNEVFSKIKIFCNSQDITLYMYFQAVFSLLLSRYCNQEDIVIGSPSSNRHYPNITKMLGFFVNTLVFRNHLNSDSTFKELLTQVKKHCLEAYKNQDIPFEILVEKLQIEKDTSRNPIFQVMLALHNYKQDLSLTLDSLKSKLIFFERATAKFDLALDINEKKDSLECYFEYSTDLFEKTTIKQLEKTFLFLLSYCLDHPSMTLEKIPLIEQKKELPYHCVYKKYPDLQSIPDLFEKNVYSFKNNVALVYGEKKLTYGELNDKINQYAQLISHSYSLNPQQAIPILFEPSPEMIIAIFAVLKLGCAYVPLDPLYPTERISHIIQQTGSPVVLGEKQFEGLIYACKINEIDFLPLDSNSIKSFSSDRNISRKRSLEDLAYIIYTSGSTGTPKGVVLQQKQVLNTLFWLIDSFKLTSKDNFILSTPYIFDPSVNELILPFLIGAKLSIPKGGRHKNLKSLGDFIKQNKISFIIFVPSVFEAFINELTCNSKFPDIKYVIFGGEKLPRDLLKKAQFCFQGEVMNVYGPTEGSVITHAFSCKNQEISYLVPIGKSIPNTYSLILDKSQHPLPPLFPGELHLGGSGIAKGYFLDDKKTSEKFIYLDSDKRDRLYKTGDLVRMLPDNNLQFIDRIDNQVKVRGLRIELDEISNVLNQHPLVQKSLVKIIEEKNKKNIHAYFIPKLNRSETESNTFNIAGWNNSVDGKALTKKEMQEWVDNTIDRIKEYPLKKALEIGCGTGLLLFSLAKSSKSYLGLDFSDQALNFVSDKLNNQTYKKKVKLLRHADQLDRLPPNTFDTIIINSVIQYFPDIGYLNKVLQKATDLSSLGGKIFIGDVRDNRLLEVFYLYNYLERINPYSSKRTINLLLKQLIKTEKELLISPDYFLSFAKFNDKIQFVEIQPKKGKLPTEMNKFRYDVILHMHPEKIKNQQSLDITEIEWEVYKNKKPNLSKSKVLEVKNIPNHLQKDLYKIGDWLYNQENQKEQLQVLKKNLKKPNLQVLNDDKNLYSVKSIAGSHIGCFNQIFFHSKNDKTAYFEQKLKLFSQKETSDKIANNPRENNLLKTCLEDLPLFLSKKLPNYMLPNGYTALEEFPFLRSGKINMNLLPYFGDEIFRSKEIILPEGTLQKKIAAIWSKILKIKKIAIEDNFFHLGGNSLSAVSLVSNLTKAFNVFLTVDVIFNSPTIKEQGEYLLKNDGIDSKNTTFPKLKKINRGCEVLSFAQERLWFLDNYLKKSGIPAYNIPLAIQLNGKLDDQSLEKAFLYLIDRHEILRTVFVLDKKGPKQKILNKIDFHLQKEQIKEKDLLDRLKEESLTHFDLSKGPLFKAFLFSTRENKHVLFINQHHIISDEWSIKLFLKELFTCYLDYTSGREVSLSENAYQFLDFAVWHKKLLTQAFLKNEIRYWKKKLKDIEPLTLPTDKSRPKIQTYHGQHVHFTLDPSLKDKVNNFCTQNNCTSFMFFQAAFSYLLSCYSRKEAITIGSPIANRHYPQTENMLGFFVNTLVFYHKIDRNQSFQNFLLQVKNTCLEAYAHQDIPFETVVDSLKLERDLSRNPLFQVMLVVQDKVNLEDLFPSELKPSLYPVEYPIAKFDLTLFIQETNDAFDCIFEYNRDLFKKETIDQIAKRFSFLIKQILKNPSHELKEYSLVTSKDLKLLQKYNKTEKMIELDRLTIDHFNTQVEKNPDKVAVVEGDLTLTYDELDKKSNKIANLLLKNNFTSSLIGLYQERSIFYLISLLGVLKSGNAFIPLDPKSPQKKNETILSEANPVCILSLSSFDTNFIQQKIFDVEEILKEGNREKVSARISPDDLAYVLFTSGSTGTPKGAMIEHKGMLNHLLAKIADLNLSERDSIAQTSSHLFDVSIWQFLAPLISGGKLFIYSQNFLRDPSNLLLALSHNKISIFETVPSHLSIILDVYESSFSNLSFTSMRWCLMTGESLLTSLSFRWYQLFPNIKMLNAYGPTECSDDVTHHRILEKEKSSLVAIGKPIQNLKAYIVDSNLKQQPIGMWGEICISGIGVGRGYLNTNSLNFTSNPFSKEKFHKRLYKTGDLGRWNHDGNLEFKSRIDFQVKIRGLRIELGEIEEKIKNYPLVQDAAVVVHEVGDKKDLVGFYTSSGKNIEKKVFKYLKEYLTDYMIPSTLIALPSFPRLPSSKIDRKALINKIKEIQTKPIKTELLPKTEIEKNIHSVWQSVLKKSSIGIHQNFFQIGGNSLLLIKVVNELNKNLKINLTVIDFFRNPTVFQLACHLKNNSSEVEQIETRIITRKKMMKKIKTNFDKKQRHT